MVAAIQLVSPDPEYPDGQSPQMRPLGMLVHVVSGSHPPLLSRHSLTSVGGDEGLLEGFGVGEAEGRDDGRSVGDAVGIFVGGRGVGAGVGEDVGSP